jgi:hypothetical protein
MLTVTDDQGRTDSATLVLSSSSIQTSAPAAAGGDACLAAVAYSVPPPNSGSSSGSGGSSHGGGGAFDLMTVLALAGFALAVAVEATGARLRGVPSRRWFGNCRTIATGTHMLWPGCRD